MKYLKRALLLNKRFLSKPGFIFLLAMIILFSVILAAVASRPHGVVSIALCGDPGDEIYAAVKEHLLSEQASGTGSVVTIKEYGDESSAREAVVYGECDGAWIFTGDTSASLDRFVSGSSSKPVTVIERKDTVGLRLAREKLSAALSPYLAQKILEYEYRQNADPDADAEKLAAYYEDAFYAGDIFRYVNIEGVENSGTSYLTYPLRGFLAVAVLLCGLVISMYHNRDDKNMVFSAIPHSEKPIFAFFYHFTGVFDVALVSFAALYICGSTGRPGFTDVLCEISSMLFLCVSCTAIGILAGRIIKSETVLATLSALVAVSQLIINPVFLDIPGILPLRLLTPVFLYIRVQDDKRYLAYLLIYTAVAVILAFASFLPDIISPRRSVPADRSRAN